MFHVKQFKNMGCWLSLKTSRKDFMKLLVDINENYYKTLCNFMLFNPDSLSQAEKAIANGKLVKDFINEKYGINKNIVYVDTDSIKTLE